MAFISSSASCVRYQPFVLIAKTSMSRLYISRRMSKKRRCAIGSPPVIWKLVIPQSRAWSSSAQRSSNDHSVIRAALSAALKQCRQLKLHFPVIMRFIIGKHALSHSRYADHTLGRSPFSQGSISPLITRNMTMSSVSMSCSPSARSMMAAILSDRGNGWRIPRA